MDELDTALLRLLLEEPRAGMPEYARTLGFPVLALVRLHLAQGRRDEVAARDSLHLDAVIQ